MKLIVALGNPGDRFARTRHNVGWMVVDAIHDRMEASDWQQAGDWGQVSQAVSAGETVLLLKPQTYMNDSGRAVAALMAKHPELTISDVTVIHDDLDLAPGYVRTKTGGGDGGHNGLKSITNAIGKDYDRLRIGIGHPRGLGQPLDRTQMVLLYVLGDFSHNEMVLVEALQTAIADGSQMVVARRNAEFLSHLRDDATLSVTRGRMLTPDGTLPDTKGSLAALVAWAGACQSTAAVVCACIPVLRLMEEESAASNGDPVAASQSLKIEAQLAFLGFSPDTLSGLEDEGHRWAVAAVNSVAEEGQVPEGFALPGKIKGLCRNLELWREIRDMQTRAVGRLVDLRDGRDPFFPGQKLIGWRGSQPYRLLTVSSCPSPYGVLIREGGIGEEKEGRFEFTLPNGIGLILKPATPDDVEMHAAQVGRTEGDQDTTPPTGPSILSPVNFPEGFQSGREFIDAQVIIDDIFPEGLDLPYGPLMAYLHRRFGPATADANPDKNVCGRWLLGVSGSEVIIGVQPQVSASSLTFSVFVRTGTLEYLRMSKGVDTVRAQHMQMLRAVQSEVRQGILDLLRPVMVRDVSIDLLGRHEGWLPDRGWHHMRSVEPVAPSSAATVGIPARIMEASWAKELVQSLRDHPGSLDEVIARYADILESRDGSDEDYSDGECKTGNELRNG